jgi:hypothetical protein
MKYLTNLSKKMNPSMKFLKKNHKSVLIVLLLLVLVFLVLRTVREKFEDTTLMSLNNADWIEKCPKEYILDVNYDFVRIAHIEGRGATQRDHNNYLGKYENACHTIKEKCDIYKSNPAATIGQGKHNRNGSYYVPTLPRNSLFLQFDFGGEMRKVNGVVVYGRGKDSSREEYITKLSVTASIKEPKSLDEKNDKDLQEEGDRYGFNFGMNTEKYFGRDKNTDTVLDDGEQWENGYLKGDNLISKNDGSIDENVSIFTMPFTYEKEDERKNKPLYYIKFNKPVLCNAIRIDRLSWKYEASLRAGLIVDEDFKVNTEDGKEIGQLIRQLIII